MFVFYNICMEIINNQNYKTLIDIKTEHTIKKYLPPKTSLSSLSNIFSALSDNGRLQIISALAISELCVSDMALLLEINQTTLSHQLKVLRDANLISCQRQGKTSFYSLKQSAINDLMLCATNLSN